VRVKNPLILSLTFLALACSDDDGPADPQMGDLVVQAQAATSAAAALPASAMAVGDPDSFTLTFYAFYVAENADCSSPVLLSDLPAGGVSHDMLTNPTLFTVSGEPGTYECLVLRISDVMQFTSGSTFGPCTAGASYQTDVYREGETDWRDVAGSTIVGRGSDTSPVNDRPDVVFTTDRESVIARGYSPNQVQTLVSGAVLPGTSTLVYDVSGAVVDEGGSCRILPGAFEFR